MLEYLRRRQEDEKGFTLIELMVVVLIIAILIAIAIPTFLGAQDRARDRAAQSDLRNAFTAAKSIATDFEGSFKTASGACADDGTLFADQLEEENASLSYGVGTGAQEDTVFVLVEDQASPAIDCGTILLQRLSTSGNNYCLAADQQGNTFRDVQEDGTAFGGFTDCAAEDGW